MKALSSHATDSAFAFFKGLPLFTDIERSEVDAFINAGRTKAYKKGESLYSEGDVGMHFYIVCSGWVKLYRVTSEGEKVNLSMLTAGSITGQNTLFENGRFGCSARIVEDADIIVVPLSLLKEGLNSDPKLAHNMMVAMVRSQRHHEELLEHFLLYSAPQRIGCFLLALSPEPKQRDGVILTLPYDKRLIASTLSMKGATFSRALNILRKETGIHIKGTQVKVGSVTRLLKFVDGCYTLGFVRE